MPDASAGFRACRPHTNLYKFGEYVSPHIFNKKNCCGLNLPFFSQILDSIYWTVLIFYFDLLWMVWHWKPAIANDGETESLHFLSNKGRKSIGSIWLGVRGHFTKKHDLYGSREIKNAIFKSWINSAKSECYIDQGTCFLEAKRFWEIKRLNEERFREAEIAMECFFLRNIS